MVAGGWHEDDASPPPYSNGSSTLHPVYPKTRTTSPGPASTSTGNNQSLAHPSVIAHHNYYTFPRKCSGHPPSPQVPQSVCSGALKWLISLMACIIVLLLIMNLKSTFPTLPKPEWTLEREIERYRDSGMHWERPYPSEHCESYNNREYYAQLRDLPSGYDLNKACMYMRPTTIDNQTFDHPTLCDNRGRYGMYGVWRLEDISCKPFWGEFRESGCLGAGSGISRVESRLWGLGKGDDWMKMCISTPAAIHAVEYRHPSHCNDKGLLWGIWGVWDIADSNCEDRANDLEDLGEEEPEDTLPLASVGE